MSEMMEFSNREEFRKWLCEHCLSEDGVWLLFGKSGGPKTIKAADALEEALCYGWIDRQMKSIDDKAYKKYFSMRRAKSKWSEKNKTLVKSLEERGLMTEHGRKKIEEAKKMGSGTPQNPCPLQRTNRLDGEQAQSKSKADLGQWSSRKPEKASCFFYVRNPKRRGRALVY